MEPWYKECANWEVKRYAALDEAQTRGEGNERRYIDRDGVDDISSKYTEKWEKDLWK